MAATTADAVDSTAKTSVSQRHQLGVLPKNANMQPAKCAGTISNEPR